MTPWFIATEKYDKSHASWAKYIAWSGLTQLREVVSLDSMLCPTLLPDVKTEYWTHIVNENFMLRFFLDEQFLRQEVQEINPKNFLCVFRNPPSDPDPGRDSNLWVTIWLRPPPASVRLPTAADFRMCSPIPNCPSAGS
jgi:hypothetical protein